MPAAPTRILFVEDDEDDYLLTTEYLGDIEDFRHEIQWASTFEDGLELLAKKPFDICLVDFRIGGLTGIEFVEEAKKVASHVPVVFLTGMGDRQTDIAAMEAGAFDFLEKAELTASTLDRAIRYAINQARGRRFLMERTALLQATLDNTGAGIAALDTEGHLVAWNDPFVSVLERLAPETGEKFVAEDAQAELSDIAIDDRFPQLRATCSEHVCADGVIYSIIRNDIAEGGAVIVCNDVTQQKLAVNAMREAVQHAESANRAKSTLISNMSHELRTPLNAIIGFADLIMGQAQGPIGCDDYEGYVGFIRDSGRNLLNIINTTIDLARIEAEEYRLDVAPFAVSEAVATSIREVETVAVDADVSFDVTIDNDERSVTSDVGAVSKVLTQVLSNAVKFSPQGGVVQVNAQCREEGASIDVIDHGIGMEPQDIERALSPFAQVDQELARNYEGAGLGLPLAKSLVEFLGGHLSISSAKRVGTTVHIDVPDLKSNENSRPGGYGDQAGLLSA